MKDLVADHGERTTHIGPTLATEVRVAAGELQAAEFKLLMNKIKHDTVKFKNYKNQMASEESKVYFERLAYQQQRCRHAHSTVKKLFAEHDQWTKHTCVKIIHERDSAKILAELMQFKKSISATHSISTNKIST